LYSVYIYPLRRGLAPPPLWQDNFGDELAVVSDCDDCAEAVALPFPFPFNGSTFNMAYVGSNGCMQLGGLGMDGRIPFSYYIELQDFLSDSDPDNPLICPFNSDFTTNSNVLSTIYYNDSQNPVIITWDRVAAIDNEDALATFQTLLYENGLIVFNYNGILNGPGDNIIDDLSNGIVSGVTPSDLTWNDEPFVPGDPGPVDLNQGPFDFGPTAYERWCFDEANSCGVDESDTGLPGPVNTAFDLDFWSICFTPNEDGFSINSGFQGQVGNSDELCFPRPIPTLSEWGLIAMAGVLGIVGFMVLRRRKVTA